MSATQKFRRPKTITKQSVSDMLQNLGPFQGIIGGAHCSLAWFIEQMFCDQRGRPLKLEAFQMVMMRLLWVKKFPLILACRGAGKSFLLALYCVLRAILVPGSRIVICGAGYRQAKLVFKYIDTLYKSSPIIQEASADRPKYGSDQASYEIGLSTIHAIPIGDGEKVRGMRATVLILDEFASIPEEIYEVVLAPFASVHANPAERAGIIRFVRRLQGLDADPILIEKVLGLLDFGNQIVISGTASYKQNHFYKQYRIYKMFIDTAGDTIKLKRALEERSLATTGKVKNIDERDLESAKRTWKQYGIFQLPYFALPEGFLDEDIIRSSKSTYSATRFAMEFLAQFPDDSDGFIKRSWIVSSTPHVKDGELPVPIELYGDPRFNYVLGIDPARWNDNIAAVVIKITPRGREVVYVAAWNRTEFGESARKIREICKRFSIQYIAMDQGGGGDAILELLHKKEDGVPPEDYLWPIKEQLENPADLAAPGRKIVELVNFTSATVDIAHDLEAAVSNRSILFPYKVDDTLVREQYSRHFKIDRPLNAQEIERLNEDAWGKDPEAKDTSDRSMGTFEEINEMINEVCAIVRDVTPGGVERFVLPNLNEQSEGLDMRRRDRFSALLLANYAAKVYSGHGHRPSNLPGQAAGMERKTRLYRHRPLRGRGTVRY
jgi:hypothetical protein